MSHWHHLEHLESVRLRGPDAAEFAQSQFTGDLEALPPDRWQPMAWCDARGQALSVLLLGRQDPGIDLILPASQAEAVASRLKLFTIRRSVTVEAGAPVSGSLQAGAGDRRLAGGDARALDLERSDADTSADFDHRWRCADLRAALPWLDDATAGHFLPQMLGLEALGGLSYGKGCFPGQEIIARVHYLGRTKRGLTGFHLPQGAPPAPGAEITYTDNGQASGTVLWALRQGAGSAGLAVMQLPIQEQRPLAVAGSAGRILAPSEIQCEE